MAKKRLNYDERMRRKVAEIKRRQQLQQEDLARDVEVIEVEAKIDGYNSLGWRILRAAGWCLWVAIAWILSAFLVALVMVFVQRYAGTNLLASTGGQIAVQSVLSIMILALIIKPSYWVGKNRKLSKAKRRADQMRITGFNRLPSGVDLMPFVYGVIVYYGVGLAVMAILGLFVPESYLTQPQDLGIAAGGIGWLDLVSIFALYCVITPICEELIFRGFLQYKVERSLGFWPATVIVSVLFAVAHGQLNAAITTFILSMVACCQRRKTGSIWSGIGLHAVVNTVATILVFVVPML